MIWPRVTAYLLGFAALALIVWVVAIAPRQRAASLERQLQAERTAHAAVLAGIAEKARRAKAAIAAATTEYKAASAANDTALREEKERNAAEEKRLLADLRDARQRLQPWWECSVPPAAGDGAAGADPAGAADAAGLRFQSASRIVGLADAADAEIRWLQSQLIATDALMRAGLNPPTRQE